MILIDDRDGSRPMADLPPLNGHSELARLDWGDALITGHGPDSSTISVGVEVKSIHDLLSSITTGRLGGTQIPRMLETYDRVFLLYYGVYRPGPDNHLQVRKRDKWQQFKLGRKPIPYSYLEGFLLTAAMVANVHSVHVYDVYEAACWLRVLDHWLEKPWDRHRALSVFDRSHDIAAPPNADPVEVQIAKTAASLPAIDWVRGWRAAKHFSSVEEMMDAGVDKWMAVPGIGPVIAKSAYAAIRRRKDGDELRPLRRTDGARGTSRLPKKLRD